LAETRCYIDNNQLYNYLVNLTVTRRRRRGSVG